MIIDEIIEIKGYKIVCVKGNELTPGMSIRKIKTPFGIINVKTCLVREACFCPGSISGFLEVDKDTLIEPCEAEIVL